MCSGRAPHTCPCSQALLILCLVFVWLLAFRVRDVLCLVYDGAMTDRECDMCGSPVSVLVQLCVSTHMYICVCL